MVSAKPRCSFLDAMPVLENRKRWPGEGLPVGRRIGIQIMAQPIQAGQSKDIKSKDMIQIFNYNDNPVSFYKKGNTAFMNASDMARPFGKKPNHWLRTNPTKEFISALCELRRSNSDELIKVVHGNNGGTWMHEDAAIEFARWLDPYFAIWCNDRIKELMKFGVTATPQALEKMVSDPDFLINVANQIKQYRNQIAQKESEINRLKPKAEFTDRVMDADNMIDIGQAAKLLNLPFGRNKLFEKLREEGIFFKNRNEPKQPYIERGYFILKEKLIKRDNHESFIVVKILVTQKGLYWLSKKFNAKPKEVNLAELN